MYDCLTHCLGPGCEFWAYCQAECAAVPVASPRCADLPADVYTVQAVPANPEPCAAP